MATQLSPYDELLNQLQTYKDGDGKSYPRVADLSPSADAICDIDLNARTIAMPSEKYALTTDIVYNGDKTYYHKVVENGKTAYVDFPFTTGGVIEEDGQKVYERYIGFLSVQFEHNAEIIYFRCPRYFQNMDLASTVCVVEYVNAHGDASLYWVPYYDVNHYSVNPDGTEEPVIIFPWAVNGMATAYEGDVTFAVRFYQLTEGGGHYHFNLATQPLTAKVLYGMDYTKMEELDIQYAEPSVKDALYAALATGLEQAAIYWTEAN